MNPYAIHYNAPPRAKTIANCSRAIAILRLAIHGSVGGLELKPCRTPCATPSGSAQIDCEHTSLASKTKRGSTAKNHISVLNLNCDLTQPIAATWAGNALAVDQFKAGAVHGAHEQAVLALQEFSWRPVEPSACMWAHIEPCACMVAVAMDDHRFDSTFDASLDFSQAAIGDGIQGDQDACGTRLIGII